MPIYTFERTQIVELPLDQSWRFFSDPRNLARITPPAMKFIVKSDLPDVVHPGLMIRYSVSPLFGIPMTWLTEITHVCAPNYFVDEQRVGPYRLWHHEHFFRALDEHRTEVRDRVHYAPPLGPLGALLNSFLIAPQLTRIFDYRAQQITVISADAHRHSFA